MKRQKLLSLVEDLPNGDVVDLYTLQSAYNDKHKESISKSYIIKVLNDGTARKNWKSLPKYMKDKIMECITFCGTKKQLITFIKNLKV